MFILKKLSAKRQKTAAFSLVELLMALLVASLLMAALAPVMTKRMNENLSISSLGGQRADYRRTWYYDKNKEFHEWTVPNGVNVINVTAVGAGGAGGGSSFGYREFTNDTSWKVPEGVTKIRVFMTAGGGAGASGGPGSATLYGDIGGSKDYKEFVATNTWVISDKVKNNIPALPKLCKDSGVDEWEFTSDPSKKISPKSTYITVAEACGGGGGGGGIGGMSCSGGGGGSGGIIRNVNAIIPSSYTSLNIRIGGGGGYGGNNNSSGTNGGSWGGGGGGSETSVRTTSQPASEIGTEYGRGGNTSILYGTGGTSDDDLLLSAGKNGVQGGGKIFLIGGEGSSLGSKKAGSGGSVTLVETNSQTGGSGGGGSFVAGGGGGASSEGGGGGGGGPTWIKEIGYEIVAPGGGGGASGSYCSTTDPYSAGGGGGGGGIGGGNGGAGVQHSTGKPGFGGLGGNPGNGTIGGASPFTSGTGKSYCAGGNQNQSGQSGYMKLSWEPAQKALKCTYTQTANGSGGGGAGQVWFGELSVTPNSTLNIKVGSGGEPSNAYAGNGGNGGDTSVGSITVKGGFGGQYVSNDSDIALSAGEGQRYRSIGLKNWNTSKISNDKFEILKSKMGQNGLQGHLASDSVSKAAGGNGGSTIDRNGNDLIGANAGSAGAKGEDATKYGTGGGGGGGVSIAGGTPGLGGKGGPGYVYIEWGGANGGGGSTGQVTTSRNIWVTPNTVAKIYVGKGGEAKELKDITTSGISEGKLGQDGNDGGDSYVIVKVDNRDKTEAVAKGGKGGIAGIMANGRGGGIKLDSSGNYDPDNIQPEIENTNPGKSAADNEGGMGGSITEIMCPLLAELKKLAFGGCGGNSTITGECQGAIITSGEGVAASGIGNGGGGGAVVSNIPHKGGNGSGGMVTIEWTN